VKVEVKQEAALEVKVEVMEEASPEVKVEVKHEPPSRPAASPNQPCFKEGRTEVTPPPPSPSPPPPEPWRTEFAIPLIYRRPSDRESVGYNTAIRQSATEASIVIIDDDDDEDEDGVVSTDAKGKALL
jgi:hypothetical protein